MSEVYIKEPATKGAVVFHTTHGDLEMELWATECPKACRNFCQLILEGYYNDTIFHRVIKDFIIQGGDATGTGEGSESIYDGQPYPDEIHPRLKFRYRGMMGVASAGAGSKTNGSQFFIAMARAPSLDRKHTLFGKVVGQTIYNLVRLNEVEVDKNDVPVDPPRIIRAELTWDPFGDIDPRFTPAPPIAVRGAEKHRREAIKNTKKLSFGDDESGSEDEAPAKSFGKVVSAHDVLSDPKLLKEAAYATSSAPSKSSREESKRAEAPRKRKDKADEPMEPPASRKAAPSGQALPPAKAARRKAAASDSENEKSSEGEKAKAAASDDSGSSSDDGGGKVVDKSDKRNSEIARLKNDIVGIKKGGDGGPSTTKKKSAWEELLSGFKTRAVKNSEKAKGKKARQAQAIGVVKDMKSFSERVRDVDTAEPEAEEIDEDVKTRQINAQDDSINNIWEEGLEESTEDWLGGSGLSFKKGEDKAFKKVSGKQKETLQIFDPLAAEGDAEMLERTRQRRSDQLKPSLRRSALSAAQIENAVTNW